MVKVKSQEDKQIYKLDLNLHSLNSYQLPEFIDMILINPPGTGVVLFA